MRAATQCLFIFCFLAGAAFGQQKVRVITKPIEPFSFTQNAKLAGFSIDLWEAVAKEAGFQSDVLQVQTVPPLVTARRRARDGRFRRGRRVHDGWSRPPGAGPRAGRSRSGRPRARTARRRSPPAGHAGRPGDPAGDTPRPGQVREIHPVGPRSVPMLSR